MIVVIIVTVIAVRDFPSRQNNFEFGTKDVKGVRRRSSLVIPGNDRPEGQFQGDDRVMFEEGMVEIVGRRVHVSRFQESDQNSFGNRSVVSIVSKETVEFGGSRNGEKLGRALVGRSRVRVVVVHVVAV